MRHAQSITDAAFQHMLREIRPGRTEKELKLELDVIMLEAWCGDTLYGCGPSPVPVRIKTTNQAQFQLCVITCEAKGVEVYRFNGGSACGGLELDCEFHVIVMTLCVPLNEGLDLLNAVVGALF